MNRLDEARKTASQWKSDAAKASLTSKQVSKQLNV